MAIQLDLIEKTDPERAEGFLRDTQPAWGRGSLACAARDTVGIHMAVPLLRGLERVLREGEFGVLRKKLAIENGGSWRHVGLRHATHWAHLVQSFCSFLMTIVSRNSWDAQSIGLV